MISLDNFLIELPISARNMNRVDVSVPGFIPVHHPVLQASRQAKNIFLCPSLTVRNLILNKSQINHASR
jgi:hypothetical protein